MAGPGIAGTNETGRRKWTHHLISDVAAEEAGTVDKSASAGRPDMARSEPYSF